jgi:2,4-dienoyl-CoA reductase-like NADH-dependent reductase (Old Yellow Enzyme family)
MTAGANPREVNTIIFYMRYPENPIRHALPEARWPGEQEAERSLLFSPIQVGPVTLESRTWVPAMVPWRATEEGFVTQNILDWYGRFAAGRPGAIVVEATGIRDIPSGPLLRIGHDRFLPGLRELVETVRRESRGHTRLFIQIIDFLTVKRRPPKDKFFARFLRLTTGHRERLAKQTADQTWLTKDDADVRAFLYQAEDEILDKVLTERELESLRFGYRERVTDVELPHIKELPDVLPEIFAAAALRSREAGFDGVELHYAHAYTMASFLSAKNNRTDGYGGRREQRVRLPLEVYRAVRHTVGGDYAVGVRFLGDEAIEGGSHLEDAVYFGVEFARAGFDYLSVSKGGKFDDAKQPKVGHAVYPYTGPSGYECMPTVLSDARGPFGRNVPLAAAIKAAVNQSGLATPVVTSGGISTFEMAEAILERGEADIIAAARQSLADPDWFLKTRLGRGNEVRRCVFTNYCEGLDQMHKQVTCKLWDREHLDEPEITLSSDGRRRLVPPKWEGWEDDSDRATR